MTERDEFFGARDRKQAFHNFDGLWLPKIVDERLVEAAKLAQRTAGPTGPREDGNAWPKFQREFLDWYDEIKDEFGNIIGHVQTGEPEKKMPYIPARKISQMEAAIQWPMHYLKEHDGPRNVLSVYLRCKAYRKPFGQACKRLGWPRATAYRARDKALSLIAQGLNSDGIPLD
ncbi:hypothetical protein I6H96_02645 [Brucella anthropi]|uniref:Uncharacterized protein n=1 Tax=Brucella anthropi (strain ATCC 49188 / DSM 6882 / CCUG 24695 / JCM 21032 / LMG 3331 / NBRC 15819 / NCTC 12168 / Alc 37) TaxID=439375 RepID=A6WZ46_BRUA4|nr:hypothetical protein [Brucella anthropi]ABS14250.1 hypothetical protein Oant_1534 [Brucella anthropi ATCC 49188]QQC25779.1 hypothetical protein I6H96_02645 [Brucella anthropi]SUA65457.1 Uncharacterised protein [Brucella anthropi]